MPQNVNSKKPLIIDTCILRYLNSKPLGNKILDYLRELKEKGYKFSISDISTYELLEGVPKQKEKAIFKVLKLLNRHSIEEKILIISARLHSIYKQEDKSHTISLADKIIASTAIFTRASIVTADVNDFPRPFFVESERNLINYKEGNRDRMLPIYLLKPDYQVILARFSERP